MLLRTRHQLNSSSSVDCTAGGHKLRAENPGRLIFQCTQSTAGADDLVCAGRAMGSTERNVEWLVGGFPQDVSDPSELSFLDGLS